MQHVAPLRYGVIFKKAFSKPEIFTAFVKAVLAVDRNDSAAEIELQIDKVETEKSFKPAIGKVDCRYDLYAEDTKNRMIIDIQHDRTADHYHRFLYYHMMAVAEQIANAKGYKPNLQVITIVVLTGYDRHQADLATIQFDPVTHKGKPLGEIPHKIIYLAPHYITDETPEPLREWLRAINDTLDEYVDETTYDNPLIRHIFDEIKEDDLSPTERAKMFEENNQEELRQAQYQLGATNKQIEIARALLAQGVELAIIATATGLPRETLATL